jgi:DNA-binding CsgD family transcriptional regulator
MPGGAAKVRLGTGPGIEAERLLLERGPHLARIAELVEAAREGSGSCLLVRGAAGIGKTELLHEVRGAAATAGCLVMTARGGLLEREMPFGTAQQLLEPRLRTLSQDDREALLRAAPVGAKAALGFDSSEDGDTPSDAFAVIHGLYWLCVTLAERAPAVVILDDAHWSDAPSLRWVDYLARRVGELPILLVLAARPAEAGAENELVEAIAAEPSTEVLALPPLGEASVARLVRSHLGEGDDEFCRACHRATGGNPFLVRELLRAARADRLEPVEANAGRVGELGSSVIAHSVLVRLARQGPAPTALALAVAVLGANAVLADAAALAGLGAEEAIGAADTLRAADILDVSDRLDFVHPLVRAAVCQELGPARRSADHLRAARLLASHGASGDQVALHLLSAFPGRDPWVVAALRTAARQALTAGAPDAAVRYLQRALDEPAGDDDRPAVLFELGVALSPLDPATAVEHLRRALDLGVEAEFRTEVAVRLAKALAHSDQPGEGVTTLERVIAEVGPQHPALRLRLEAELGLWSAFWPDDPARAEHRERLHRVAASVTGSSLDERVILGFRAWDEVVGLGSVTEALAFADRASAEGISFANYEFAVTVSVSYMYCDALARAHEELSKGIADLRRLQWHVLVAFAHAQRAHVGLRQGALLDAEADARTSWELARQLGPGVPAWWYAVINLIQVLVARGHVAEADGLITGEGLADQLPDALIFPLPRVVRAQVRLAQGRLDEGVDELLAVGAWEEARGFLNPSWSPWRMLAAPALSALGRHAEAEALSTEALRRARAFGAPWALGLALRADGLVRGGDEGIELLGESVTVLAASPCRHEHAVSLVELGAALRRSKQVTEARPPLRQGLDAAERCGATGLARRAESELTASGARPRRRLVSGRDSLTASERRVVQLADEGLGNNEIARVLFVSRKTVEKHLANAYLKLGITSRAGLRGALTEDAGP